MIPPPVDPGDAPINIKKIKMIKVAKPSVPKSKELNPAVRALVEWKIPLTIFSIYEFPILLLCSSKIKVNPPNIINIHDVINDILVVRCNLFHFSFLYVVRFLDKSVSVGNPIAPRNISTDKIIFKFIEFWKSFEIVNPALLNALIEWKIESKI